LIDIERNCIVALPRPISLKNQSIATIAGFWPDAAMSAVVHDTLKGSVVHVKPPRKSVQASAQPALPGWIVLPAYRPSNRRELARVSKASAFMQLVDSAFNYSLHGRRGFDALARFVEASECYRFTYGGDLEDAVQVFNALTEPA
jgi:HprK-related kinase A